MENSIVIFISGIAGVFIGMGFLYGSIRITAWVVDRFYPAQGEGK